MPDNICISTQNADLGRSKQNKALVLRSEKSKAPDGIFIENTERRAKTGKRRGTSVTIAPNSTRKADTVSHRPLMTSPTPQRILSPIPQRSVLLSPKQKRREVMSPTSQRSTVISPTQLLEPRSAFMSPPQQRKAPKNNNQIKKKVHEQSSRSDSSQKVTPSSRDPILLKASRARTPSEDYQEHSLSSSGEEVAPPVKGNQLNQ